MLLNDRMLTGIPCLLLNLAYSEPALLGKKLNLELFLALWMTGLMVFPLVMDFCIVQKELGSSPHLPEITLWNIMRSNFFLLIASVSSENLVFLSTEFGISEYAKPNSLTINFLVKHFCTLSNSSTSFFLCGFMPNY